MNEMDLTFYYKGEKIGVLVKDDNRPVRPVNGVEKISGYLSFYNDRGHCGTIAYYENYEEMTPISDAIAIKYYEKMIKG